MTPEDLQNEGIIPRSPSPEGTSIEREIAIRTKKRQRSATIVLSSDEEDGDVTFVAKKRVKTVVGGMIDLTED
jgi:hypothetical protein